jgi:hypothetical protein
MTNQPGREFNVGDTFIFNDMPIPNSTDVVCDFDTGIFTLYSGIYTITWQLMVDLAWNPNMVQNPYAAVTMILNGEAYSVVTMTVSYPMILTGSAMIKVPSGSTQMYLCVDAATNAADTYIKVVDGPTQAKMTIAKNM